MQALPLACGACRATCSIKAASMDMSMHQQGGCGCPVSRATSIAQRLSPPHKGQRVASMSMAAGMRCIVLQSRVARAASATGCISRRMPSQKDRMLAGELYDPSDAEIQADQIACHSWLARFNASLGDGASRWRVLLQERLGAVGAGSVVRPPFHCDYGYNLFLGEGVFLNFNCTVLDVVPVHIGDRTQIGPGVQILSADHPRSAHERSQGLEFGRPIRIGKDVWVGGGALILPGVTIGDGAIIGAGSVVTRDVPEGATALGNPARVR
jgi:maltose O-acetyltransferase